MRFTEDLIKIFSFATEEALRTGCPDVGPDHMMLALLRCREDEPCVRLAELGVDLDELKLQIETYLQAPGNYNGKVGSYEDIDSIKVSGKGRNIMTIAATLAYREGVQDCTGLHLLKAIIKERSSYGARCLHSIWNIEAEQFEFTSGNKTPKNEKTNPNCCIYIHLSDGNSAAKGFES